MDSEPRTNFVLENKLYMYTMLIVSVEARMVATGRWARAEFRRHEGRKRNS